MTTANCANYLPKLTLEPRINENAESAPKTPKPSHVCAGQETSVCGIANPEATYWANNTIANSSDKSEHADETIEDLQGS